MHEDDISIAALADLDGRAGADSNDINLDPGFLLEQGENIIEKARVLSARGGCAADARFGESDITHQHNCQKNQKSVLHGEVLLLLSKSEFLLFTLQKGLEILMEPPEHLDRLFSGLGNARAAPAFATGGYLNKWLLCLPVHRIHEVPGMAIGHVHRFGGLGDRTMLDNALQQNRPAVAEEGALRAIHPDPAAKARPRWSILFFFLALFRHERNIAEGITGVNCKIERPVTALGL